MNLKKFILPAALLFPFTVLIIYTILQVVIISSGLEVIFPISGYDPRDLLSGHYLTFQVDYASKDKCVSDEFSAETESCFCIKTIESSGLVKEGYFDKGCINKNSCVLFIRGDCAYEQFSAGIERYYINESKASFLDKKLRKEGAHIKLSVDSTGKALIKDIIWDFK